MKKIEKLSDFVVAVNDILISDRDVNIGVGGMTGEGKSVFMTQFLKYYCKLRGIPFTFNCMTWDRAELLEWVDGSETPEFGGQKPEFSGIIADELISMFYKRNWYEDAQKASIELFNKCRDRHLLIIGGVPNFWDLDKGMLNRFRFYIYIPERGIAWVFQQENNPFSNDSWNLNENKKMFRKHLKVGRCPNFLFELRYDDLNPKEKDEYYNIRNTKRKDTENQNRKKGPVKYREIKEQRNILIRYVREKLKCPHHEIAELIDMDRSAVTNILNGEIV